MNHNPVDIVREMLEKMGIVPDSVTLSDDPTHAVVAVAVPDAKLLIGPRGEHLAALNMVVRRIAEVRLPPERAHFLVDVNGYHEERINDLKTKARMIAERVRTFKTSTELSPMNAYERMIVHAMFAEDPEITTHSEGVGKDRRIVLAYRERGEPAF